MKDLKSKKALITLLFSGTILFSNSFPILALEVNSKKEIALEKADSTKIKAQGVQTQNSTEEKKEIQKSKSTTGFTYNVIYYLISMFLKINPLSRPG